MYNQVQIIRRAEQTWMDKDYRLDVFIKKIEQCIVYFTIVEKNIFDIPKTALHYFCQVC